MALRVRNVSGTFEKRAPSSFSLPHSPNSLPLCPNVRRASRTLALPKHKQVDREFKDKSDSWLCNLVPRVKEVVDCDAKRYRRLHLPVNALPQNMFSGGVKRLSFQVSNFEVFPPKCEVLLLDTAQREDVSNIWERIILRKFFHLILQIVESGAPFR